MFGRRALRVRQCIHFARKRGVLSRRSAVGSGPLVARHRQVHASCEAETGNGDKRRSATQAHRCGVLGYKGARRKRLAQRNAWDAAADVKRQMQRSLLTSRLVVTNLDPDMEFVWTLKHLNKTNWQRVRRFKSSPRNHFVIDKAGTQDSGLFRATAGRVIHWIARCLKKTVLRIRSPPFTSMVFREPH